MEKIKLSNSVHEAPWVDATLFPHPLYNKENKKKRGDNHTSIVFWDENRKYEARYAHVPTYNIDGIENMYGPWYVCCTKMQKGHWLIEFKSQLILQSKYLKMTDEEMQKVFARKIDY